MWSATTSCSGGRPAATSRSTSRSVRIPSSSVPSQASTEPTFALHMRLHASATVSLGEQVTRLTLIISETRIIGDLRR